MDKEDLLHLIALLKTENVGPVLARNILEYFGDIKQIFKASKRQFLNIPKIGEKTAEDLSRVHRNLSEAENILKRCDKLGIKVLTYQDEDYPAILNQIYDPPLVLYGKGFVSQGLWGVGVVGTRSATEYGKEQTQILVEQLVKHQIPVISGMAHGIDYQAHKKCVDLKGRTVGVLACGIDEMYPRAHYALADEILLQGGAILSEYPPQIKVNSINFPMRNRIISGLSKAVVIIESGEKGGALITAHYAFEQNREVWALPGKITDKKSQGCNLLIQKNIARIYLRPSDVLEDLKIPLQKNKIASPALPLDLSPEETEVLKNLDYEGIEVDVLAHKIEWDIAKLLNTLLNLEIKGLVTQLPGKKVIRN